MSGFSNPLITGSGALAVQQIKSPNYVPGSLGWKVDRNGNAEFDSAQIRGNLIITNQNVYANNLPVYPELYGAVLDGITDDTAAIQSAINAAYARTKGPRHVVCDGPAAISAPLIIPPETIFEMGIGNRTDNPAPYVLKTLATFTGTAMIKMVDQATGGYATQSYGQQIRNVTLDGTAAKTAGAIFSGIRSEGLVRGVVLENVSVFNVSDRGIQNASSGGQAGYSWQCTNVQVGSAGVDGFRLSDLTDGTFTDCRAIGCTRHGWYVDGVANSKFMGCRSEWSGQRGWNIADAWGSGTGSGGAQWVGCSTDRNGFDGFYVSATGTMPLIFDVMCRRDGRNGGAGGGGYSAFRVDGATVPVIVKGITNFPGVDDDGTGTNSPQYGFRAMNATYVSVESGSLHGATAAEQSISGNSYYYVSPKVRRATGTTAAPVQQPTWDIFAGESGSYDLTVGAADSEVLSPAITFTNVYGTAPIVIPVFTNPFGLGATAGWIARAVNVSTTQFQILVMGNPSGGTGFIAHLKYIVAADF